MDLAKLNLGKYMLVLDEGEELHGPIDELVAYAEKTNRAYVFCKHFQSAPCGPYYKLRLIHREHIPENMQDFVGPKRDAAKLRGLVNYDGAVTDSVYTTGDVEPLPAPRSRLTNETAVLESVTDPSPEAHFALARFAYEARDYHEVIRQVERGQKLSDDAFEVRPWSRVERDYHPSLELANAAGNLKRYALVERALRRAESVARTRETAATRKQLRCAARALDDNVVIVHGDTQQIMERVKAAGVDFTTTENPRHRGAKLYVAIPQEPPGGRDLVRAQAAGAVPVILGVHPVPEYVFRGYWYRPPLTEAVITLMVNRIVYLLTHEPERYDLAREAQEIALCTST